MATAPPTDATDAIIKEPIDMLRLSLDDRVYVKCRNNRELRGRLHAYDQHLNMILGECEEVVSQLEVDPDTLEETVKPTKRNIAYLFIRGDGVILISPPLRK